MKLKVNQKPNDNIQDRRSQQVNQRPWRLKESSNKIQREVFAAQKMCKTYYV